MIEYITGSLGISCVEIYLLALLKKNGIDTDKLYLESFIPLDKVVYDFLNGEHTYAAYNGIQRLQDTAVKEGYISYNYIKKNEKKEFDYYLYRVIPGYKTSILTPWREDHFIMEYNNCFYDCYPPSIVEKDKNILNGDRLGITIKKYFTGKSIDECLYLIKKELHKNIYIKPYIELTPNNLMQLRDAFLIYRISRQRINKILKLSEIDFIVTETSKLINLLEAYRLRSRISDTYKELIEKICESENLWISDI